MLCSAPSIVVVVKPVLVHTQKLVVYKRTVTKAIGQRHMIDERLSRPAEIKGEIYNPDLDNEKLCLRQPMFYKNRVKIAAFTNDF